MGPISNTAFYCCGIRMRDAESARPVCGDQFAKLFMNEHGMEIYRRFAGERGPNMSNVARARYIDDLLRARLAANPRLQVVLFGCGFDSRAFRLLDTGRQLAARFFGQCERRAGDNSQYTGAQDTCKRLTCITPCSGRCCPRYYETQRHWFSRERACRSGRRRAEEPGAGELSRDGADCRTM